MFFPSPGALFSLLHEPRLFRVRGHFLLIFFVNRSLFINARPLPDFSSRRGARLFRAALITRFRRVFIGGSFVSGDGNRDFDGLPVSHSRPSAGQLDEMSRSCAISTDYQIRDRGSWTPFSRWYRIKFIAVVNNEDVDEFHEAFPKGCVACYWPRHHNNNGRFQSKKSL